jgi:DNA-binding MarR family transcriptional regulator
MTRPPPPLRRVQVPKDPSDRVAGLAILVGDRLRKISDGRYARWDLTESDYNVLRILNGAGAPLSHVAIGRRLLHSRAGITKLVDRLEARGLARRMGGPDGRTKLVAITPGGLRFLERTIDEVIGSSQGLLDPLTPRELSALERLLSRLLDHNAALNAAVKEPSS